MVKAMGSHSTDGVKHEASYSLPKPGKTAKTQDRLREQSSLRATTKKNTPSTFSLSNLIRGYANFKALIVRQAHNFALLEGLSPVFAQRQLVRFYLNREYEMLMMDYQKGCGKACRFD